MIDERDIPKKMTAKEFDKKIYDNANVDKYEEIKGRMMTIEAQPRLMSVYYGYYIQDVHPIMMADTILDALTAIHNNLLKRIMAKPKMDPDICTNRHKSKAEYSLCQDLYQERNMRIFITEMVEETIYKRDEFYRDLQKQEEQRIWNETHNKNGTEKITPW